MLIRHKEYPGGSLISKLMRVPGRESQIRFLLLLINEGKCCIYIPLLYTYFPFYMEGCTNGKEGNEM